MGKHDAPRYTLALTQDEIELAADALGEHTLWDDEQSERRWDLVAYLRIVGEAE